MLMGYGWLRHLKLALLMASCAFGLLSVGGIVPSSYSGTCSAILATCWILEALVERKPFAFVISLAFVLMMAGQW